MQRFFSLSILGLVALALAQAPTQVYSGSRSAKDQGLTLIGWGSGTISETDEAAYEGTSSLRVSTRNYFQGGIASYATPVNLANAFQDPNNLLMFALKVADSTMTLGSGVGGPGAGSNTGGAVGPGDGQEGSGRPGSGGLGQPASASSSSLGKLDKIRIILSTTDGKKSESYIPLTTSSTDKKGWIKVGIPLKAISGFDKTNQLVSAIAMSANAPGSVYVGAVSILNDATPIYGELLVGDMNIGTGAGINLTATGQGGASILKYVWSIQSADGPIFTFEGQNIAYRFRKPGTYRVSVTIADIHGLKKPFTTGSATITVN